MAELAATDFDHRGAIKELPERPGVYRMLDAGGTVLYVGKARNLRRRVASYFRASHRGARIDRLVARIRGIEVTVTHTEAEALILESQLIKALQPRYNVLLRDDKSYPYIYLSAEESWPRLGFHRGPRRLPGRYFGPFPNAAAVRETLRLLQRVFRVRQCEDSYFANRSRPCLQYQIGRCTAPCVGLVAARDYQRDVDDTVGFLEGRNDDLLQRLGARMQSAAAALQFEEAAACRDRIAQLRQVLERQHVVAGADVDMDVMACAVEQGHACVQVFTFRDGRSLGNRGYFPRIPAEAGAAEVLGAFVGQYYAERPVPGRLLLDTAPAGLAGLRRALAARAGGAIELRVPQRGDALRWVALAGENARLALRTELLGRAGMRRRFEALQQALGLEFEPARMECFDISHTQGEATVASCVVFDGNGPVRGDYRRFNIRDVTPGDDYAAMRQALRRRYARLVEGEGRLPDLLVIDGGRGQLAEAERVLAELQVVGVQVLGVAKGPDRRPGEEQLFLSAQGGALILPADSEALHLIQQIRDEAHRFAIAGHRARRARTRRVSPLEEVAGIGPQRRRALLQHFGGLQQLARAGIDDLRKVRGVSAELARRIYDTLHPPGD